MRIGLVGAGRIGAFHAGTLAAHPDVGELLVADADPLRAQAVAAAHHARALTVDALLAARPDAVVIAAATAAHAALIARAAAAGIPAFCEKPVALDLAGTVAALDAVDAAGGILQIGFQRRFDAGYRAARQAVREGRLGRLHTVRTVSSDAVPPPAAYVPLSGGLYRDCLIHDFDILRWVTGREVTEVYAAGINVGADFFRAVDDPDTAAALLTLEGGILATATATRYHAAGYDVRMELAGTREQYAVGTGPRTPMTSLEPGAGGPGPGPEGDALQALDGGDGGDGVAALEALGASEAPDASGAGGDGPGPGPGGPAAARRWSGFLDRFAAAYRDELGTFLRVASGVEPNPCEGREALRALLVAEACEVSRRERRPVPVAEIEDRARARADGRSGVKGVVA